MVVVLTACGSNDEAGKKNDEKETAKTTENQQKQMEELQKKLTTKVDEKKTVAIVNDEKISGAEYNSLLSTTQMQMQQLGQDPTSKKVAEQIKEQTINSLVGQRLLLQAADKKGYTASKDEIEKQLAEMKGRFENDEKFNEAMKQAGLNLEKLELRSLKIFHIRSTLIKRLK